MFVNMTTAERALVNNLYSARPRLTVWSVLWLSILQPVLVFLLLLGLAFFATNAPALTARAKDFWRFQILLEHKPIRQTKALPRSTSSAGQVIASNLLSAGGTAQAPATPPFQAAEVVPVAEDNRLTIPALDINVPVNFDIGPSDKAILDALKTGVVQLKDTSKPGEAGNVFIVGHSSSYAWDRSQHYPTIFATLSRLQPDDLITITYGQKKYRYAVRSQKIVIPSNLSVLNPTTTPTLSLMTCTPVGTSRYRLVITAEQIDPLPDITKTVPSQAPVTRTTLPVAR